jgi:hypothetical protein
MKDASQLKSRASLVLRTFCAFPMFLVLTVLFWELVLGLWLLSDWCYAHQWPALGFSAKALCFILGALTIFLTLRVFVWWIVCLIRTIRGRQT